MLATLRRRYPDQWEDARRCCNRKERRLILEYMTSAGPIGTNMVVKIVSELEEELSSQIPDVGSPLAKKLAWSAIGDWLIRCPLDFKHHEAV